MKKSRADQIKNELIHSIEDGGRLNVEASKELLDLLNRLFPDVKVPKDTTPMIGTNPFRKDTHSKEEDKKNPIKDFNKTLNYRVNRFDDQNDEEN